MVIAFLYFIKTSEGDFAICKKKSYWSLIKEETEYRAGDKKIKIKQGNYGKCVKKKKDKKKTFFLL